MEDCATVNRLEGNFTQAVIGIYKTAKAEIGYMAAGFLNLVFNHQGVEAAKILRCTPGTSSGYEKLWELKRLGLSMEARVLNEPCRPLFTNEDRAIARRRLTDQGYTRSEVD